MFEDLEPVRLRVAQTTDNGVVGAGTEAVVVDVGPIRNGVAHYLVEIAIPDDSLVGGHSFEVIAVTSDQIEKI